MEKSQTDATSVILHLLRQAICGHIKKKHLRKVKHLQSMWFCILSDRILKIHIGESPKNATSVTMHATTHGSHVFSVDIWKHIVKKNQMNALSVIMQPTDTGNLRAYLKTHIGEKPYKCNQCEFASSHAGNLTKHLIMHSGEKSNKCNQCEFSSSQAGHLRTHLKIHSGENLEKCNQCDYAPSIAQMQPM